MAHARAVSDDPCAVLVSVYVNPLQFGAGEDFEQYPRDLDADCLVAAQAGVDALWCPTDAQIYPEGSEQVFRGCRCRRACSSISAVRVAQAISMVSPRW